MKLQPLPGQPGLTQFFSSPSPNSRAPVDVGRKAEVSHDAEASENDQGARETVKKATARTSLNDWEEEWKEGTQGRVWKKTRVGSVPSNDQSSIDRSPHGGEASLADLKPEDSPLSARGSEVCDLINEQDEGPDVDRVESGGLLQQNAASRPHVLMPFQVLGSSGPQARSNLNKMCDAFSEPPTTFAKLRESILSYQPCAKRGKFKVLWTLLHVHFSEEQRHRFFHSTLRSIVAFAMELPDVCANPIPLLSAGESRSVDLTERQICAMLANMFLSSFPSRGEEREEEYGSVNFIDLFDVRLWPQKTEEDRISMNCQKLLAVLHYFGRMADRRENSPDDQEKIVSFSRRVLSLQLDWGLSSARISTIKLRVRSSGTIEDSPLSAAESGSNGGRSGRPISQTASLAVEFWGTDACKRRYGS